MALDRIDGQGLPRIDLPTSAPGAGAGKAEGPGQGGKSFADVLLDSIQEANRLQSSADMAIQDLAAGKGDDVAGVMTAVEKADLAFRTLMQVRNKLVDAYEELMRLRI